MKPVLDDILSGKEWGKFQKTLGMHSFIILRNVQKYAFLRESVRAKLDSENFSYFLGVDLNFQKNYCVYSDYFEGNWDIAGKAAYNLFLLRFYQYNKVLTQLKQEENLFVVIVLDEIMGLLCFVPFKNRALRIYGQTLYLFKCLLWEVFENRVHQIERLCLGI